MEKINYVTETFKPEIWDHILFLMTFLMDCQYLGELRIPKILYSFWWNMLELTNVMPSSCYLLPQNIDSLKNLMIFLLLDNKLSRILRSYSF